MFTNDELREIGKNECRAMYGEKSFQKYRKNGGFFFGLDDNRTVISCGFTTSSDEYLSNFEYHMGDETPDEFVAFVNIDPETGEVTRDYKNSKLPE